jgi:membrane protein implicated in regulation of membrane protease activity
VLTIDLFTWWAISISWSILFLIVAGFYLYASSRAKRKEDTQEETKRKLNDEHSVRAYKTQLKATAGRIAKDFIFVWILLGLLVFYIFSVQLGTGRLSEAVFAGGNIVVEALLVFYLFRNREKTQSENRTKSK